MTLSEIIKTRIREEGPISFRDYMEMALYYPGLGYYTSNRDKIGEAGDFYTSSNLTPAFGAAIGRQLEEMWEILGKKPFTVIEFGAGTGILARDILAYLKHNDPLYEKLHYTIIEKSPEMREMEKKMLPEKVSWSGSIQDLTEISGCILSNELLDNFAIHQVVMNDELMEVFVDEDHGFTELLRPAGHELKNYLEALDVHLPRGFRTEINLDALDWIKEIAIALHRGFVLTIDYGYPSAELYQDYRNQGTLICYNKHRINENPYQDIGQQDITSHVNFTALHHWGLKNGLEGCGFTDQGHFLRALGFEEILKEMIMREEGINYKKEIYLVNRLLYDMGRKYKVLIQSKGIPDPGLRGLSS